MDDPQQDQKINDERESVTAHPGGTEGAPAQVESSGDSRDLMSEHSSHKEPEISKELERAGVTTNQPTSLRDDLKKPIDEASGLSSTGENKTISNLNVSVSDEKGDIGSGKTWLGAILTKINKLREMFGSKSHVNEPKSV